ncbi:MAG: MarR family winged helix-turn-helix transcriptional regulator [Candidatus Polarisedimenticolaceae bacterium]|nr:MarR family winged helix-turn-helix transcriptional regulator [Candidatus Polarisedimenticolaceae bacterium]
MHETGLRGTQFTLLVMIAANEPITISHLAEKLVMDRTTLTRNLRPLEKQELVDVVQGEDRRTRAVRLSKSGHKSLAEALPLWKKAQKKVVSFMGEEQMTDLLDKLHTLEKITGI